MAIKQRKLKMNDFKVAQTKHATKPHPRQAISTNLFFTIGNKGTYLSNRSNDLIYVYHVEKTRAKFTQKKTILNKHGGIGLQNRTVSTKVRDAGWTMRVFAFPSAIVKTVKQHTRHFNIEITF